MSLILIFLSLSRNAAGAYVDHCMVNMILEQIATLGFFDPSPRTPIGHPDWQVEAQEGFPTLTNFSIEAEIEVPDEKQKNAPQHLRFFPAEILGGHSSYQVVTPVSNLARAEVVFRTLIERYNQTTRVERRKLRAEVVRPKNQEIPQFSAGPIRGELIPMEDGVGYYLRVYFQDATFPRTAEDLILGLTQGGGGLQLYRLSGPSRVHSMVRSESKMGTDPQGHVAIVVTWFVGQQKHVEYYTPTDRTTEMMKNDNIYPHHMLDHQANAGLEVLDVGCSRGAFVEQGRASGNDHYFGLDPEVSDLQLSRGYYYRRSAKSTGLERNRFDVIYSTYSVLAPQYQGNNPVVVHEVLTELSRILKPGGVLRISPVNLGLIRKTLTQMPELKIVDEPRTGWNGQVFVEIRKVH